MKTLSSMLIALTLAGAAVQTAHAAGDPERGKTLFTICTTCHGPDARGMKELNAPALAGREAWYIARQLQNFKSGVRGKNPADLFGQQMAPMAMTLPDAQAIDDIAAYVESLPK
jgi:cytochrome c oxidase subunit 2